MSAISCKYEGCIDINDNWRDISQDELKFERQVMIFFLFIGAIFTFLAVAFPTLIFKGSVDPYSAKSTGPGPGGAMSFIMGTFAAGSIALAINYDRAEELRKQPIVPNTPTPIDSAAITNIKMANFETLRNYFCEEARYWAPSVSAYSDYLIYYKRTVSLQHFANEKALNHDQANFVRNILESYCEFSDIKARLECQLKQLPNDGQETSHDTPEMVEAREKNIRYRNSLQSQIINRGAAMREIEEHWNRQRPHMFPSFRMVAMPSSQKS